MSQNIDKVENTFDRIKSLTIRDLMRYNSTDPLFRHTVEELGELAAAITITNGEKPHKKLLEDIKSEAVDLILCAISMYYAHGGGDIGDFIKIAKKKLDKWESNNAQKD